MIMMGFVWLCIVLSDFERAHLYDAECLRLHGYECNVCCFLLAMCYVQANFLDVLFLPDSMNFSEFLDIRELSELLVFFQMSCFFQY